MFDCEPFSVQRIGCFTDVIEPRDLPVWAITGDPPITPLSCRDTCKALNNPYAGTQVRSLTIYRNSICDPIRRRGTLHRIE